MDALCLGETIDRAIHQFANYVVSLPKMNLTAFFESRALSTTGDTGGVLQRPAVLSPIPVFTLKASFLPQYNIGLVGTSSAPEIKLRRICSGEYLLYQVVSDRSLKWLTLADRTVEFCVGPAGSVDTSLLKPLWSRLCGST